MSPIPSSFHDNSPNCTSFPSAASHPISDDTIIDVHHDVDEDLPQDLPEAPDELMVPDQALRRSSRVSKPPSYLQAYHCNQVTTVPTLNMPQSGTSHPLSSFLSYDHLSPSYKSFCCSISSIVEPQFYSQVVSDPKWQAAMQLWRLIILGPLLLFPQTKRPLGVNGFIGSNISLMALWKDTKLGWLLRVLPRKMAWIILRPLALLPRWCL